MNEENITILKLEDKEITLIGTAHVSKQSAEQVKQVIESERPDTVCIELDEQRYQTIRDENAWNKTDIIQVIKQKKATLLLMNLVISSFQRRMANQFGIKPGQEMLQGIESAQAIGANLVMADRNIQVTFARIWHGIGFWGKSKLIVGIISSVFNNETISEEELEKMKSQDQLQTILDTFTETFPKIKTPLIDERDQYLAQKIKESPGKKIVAVVGAAHVPGIKKEILKEHDMEELNKVPAKSKVPIIVAWAIPLFILAIIGYTFYTNPAAGLQQSLSWIIWNGAFAGLGAALALAHPLSILTAIVAAPFTSLNPLMAAGWFSGIVQVYFRRPNVEDFNSLPMDVTHVKGFWSNKLTRILLIITLTNIGSVLGTVIGGADVVRLFLENFN
jgi:pheromone shutdown-related protein TraB